jgi:hypothetical protein
VAPLTGRHRLRAHIETRLPGLGGRFAFACTPAAWPGRRPEAKEQG